MNESYITKDDMIASPLGRATVHLLRAFAFKIRTLKTLRPDQLADFLESHAESIACDIYEQTGREMRMQDTMHAFRMIPTFDPPIPVQPKKRRRKRTRK